MDGRSISLKSLNNPTGKVTLRPLSSYNFGNNPNDKVILRPASCNDHNKKVISQPTKQPLTEIIQQNLRPLYEKELKKKQAQAVYYSKEKNRSPLSRADAIKGPVHSRLGTIGVNQNRKKVPIYGTNTTAILPKNKYNFNRMQNDRRRNYGTNLLYQSMQNRNLYNYGIMTRKIPHLKVQVPNTPALITRFKMILDPVYQDEIQRMQMESPREIIHSMYPVMPVATGQTLNFRFSNLS